MAAPIGPVLECACPVTKTLNVFFQVTDPPASNNHEIKWRVAGTSTYTTVSPNPTPVLVSAPNNYKVEIANVPACQDVEVSIQRQCPNNQNSIVQTNIAPATVSYGCTQTVSGTRTGSTFYIYPSVLLDFTNAPDSFVINYNVNDPNNPSASNPPNRFYIKDVNGSTVWDTNWRGVANYPGQWGTSSLNTATSGGVTFTKTAGSCFYSLFVETLPNGTQTDNWSINLDCTTITPPVADPTITLVSCSAGVGRYQVSAAAGTVIKLGITASDLLTNNNGPSNCARIDSTLTASSGETVSAVSALVTNTSAASVGGSNSVFITFTIPAAGYTVIDTEVLFKNSGISGSAAAAITIFEVNGVAKNITRSVCIGSQTATIPCVTTPTCTCPTGYTASPDGSRCLKEETTAATAPTETTNNRTLVAKTNLAYAIEGTILYTAGFNATNGKPIGNNTYAQDLAAGNIIKLTTPFWRNTLTNSGPLNRTGVWTVLEADGQTIGFSTCINISQSKTYLVGFGCDNFGDIKLNGNSILVQNVAELNIYYNSDAAPFKFWHVYPINIPAGNNVLQVTGNNISSWASVGVEIYDATFGDLSSATSYTDLGTKLLFSTKDLRNTVVTGGNTGTGYTCPTDYVLKSCGLTTPVCYKVTYANCEPTGTVQYSKYVADKYSCTSCSTPAATDVLVAFVSTFSPAINSFYLPRDRDGFVYKIKSTSTSTDPAVIMSDIGRSTCAAVCALNTVCYTVAVNDPGATVVVQYINPATGQSTTGTFSNLNVVTTLAGNTPSIITGSGLLTGPYDCLSNLSQA